VSSLAPIEPSRCGRLWESTPAIREQDDATHRVPGLPVLHHPGSFPQPLGDVGAAIDDEGVDSLQGLLLSEGGHLPEWEQPAGRRGEGDNGEAVTRVIVFDHEPHGTLQERKLGARHAPTDVEHNHQIQWCSGAQPRQHMRSLQMDQDGKLLLCCGLLLGIQCMS
jgi:hypothetical protein